MSQKKIGAKIVIDGEQEFRQALIQSKNAMKEFDSEMKLVTSQFKDNEKSMEALKSKQAVYQKQQAELTKQSKLLVEQIQKASAEYKKASEVQQQQADKIKKLQKALEDAKSEYGDSADEVQKLERELAEANDEYSKQERALNSLEGKITKWNTDLNKTQTELIETDRALDQTNDAIEHYDEATDKADAETKQFGITMGGAAKNTESLRVSLGSLVSAQVVVDVLRSCAHAIKEVATAALDVGMKFESSMSNVQALSGATGETLDALGEKAREMGSKTIYSASESADAFSYMALAGWDAEQMLEGIEPVLNLAAAANMDLAEASDIVTDYITAFGLSAEDAAHFSDAMATAMSTSNTTVELLGESYKNCAATCGSLGIAMEDATAVLMTMANAGVKGGEAGTALNSILTRLATNTKNCNDKLEKFGVEVYDSQGNMNSLSSILNGLAKVWGDLSQQEQAALAKSIAGVSHYSKFQTIMLGVSEAAKEGGQSFDDYAAALRDCEGAAENMAKVMQDNLAGDITILKSALEGLGIATEGVFDDSFRLAVQGATDAVSRLERSVSDGDLGVSLAGLGDAIANVTANLVDSAEEGLPGFIDGLTWLLNHLDTVGALIEGVAGAYIAYEAAATISTIATEGFTVAIEANPIGLLAGAIAVAVVALKEWSDEAYEAAQQTSGQTAETEKLIDTVKTFNEDARKLVSTYNEQTDAMDAQADTAHKLVEELFNADTSETRLKEVVSELKAIYPELNIQMDEHGRIIGSTREQMDKYIDSSLKMAKVEAAKEHLTEIAKEQFEAEQKLAQQEENLAKQAEEVSKAQEKFNEVAKDGDSIFTAFSDDLYESRNALNQAKDGFDAAEQEIADTKDTITILGEQYQKVSDYISENDVVLQNADASQQAYNGTIERTIELTEDQIKEIDALGDAVSKSVEGALDLTEKWSQEWKTSTDEMTKNIQSQIDGVEKWAENLDTLANSSKVALDQSVMKYLTEMGTEGAGLVQQLVDELEKSPEKVQGFSDKMAEYLSLDSEVSSSITDSYIDVIESAQTGAADAIRGANSPVTEAFLESITEGMQEAGKEAPEALAASLEENTGAVTTAANTVGDAVIDGIKDKTGKSGEKVKEVGEKSDKALAEGLKAGAATDAAKGVSQEVYSAVADTLSAGAGSTIGANFMGAIASAIDSRGEQLLAAARRYAEEAKKIINDAEPPKDPGKPPGHADGLPYVPYDNYIARLHEGERVLTKEENKEYSALMGAVKTPSFDAVSSKLSDLADGRAVVINNDIRVDGAQDPEAWTQTFIRTLKREARMA